MKFAFVLLFGWSISAVHYHYHLAGPVDTQTLQNMIQVTQAHSSADGYERELNQRHPRFPGIVLGDGKRNLAGDDKTTPLKKPSGKKPIQISYDKYPR